MRYSPDKGVLVFAHHPAFVGSRARSRVGRVAQKLSTQQIS